MDTKFCPVSDYSLIKGVDFEDVYKKDRVFSRKDIKNKAGVYLIKENNAIVYVGMSKSCLHKACFRHFHKWSEHHKYHRVSYKESIGKKSYQVGFIVSDPFQVYKLESTIITALKLRDNLQFVTSSTINLYCPNCEEPSYLQQEIDNCISCGYFFNWKTGETGFDKENIVPF